MSHDSLRARLRHATAPYHARVDACFSVFDLGSVEGYRAFLAAHAAALWPLELGLEAAGVENLLTDWPARRRRGALARDLVRLGMAPPDDGGVVPLRLADAAECWGALYTLEGSRLGGTVLARRVATAPVLAGCLDYLSHGAGQALWPGFVAQLELAAARLPWPAICVGACAAFEIFDVAAHNTIDSTTPHLAGSTS
ncbi:biliverdin-producing heme oxygenase [Chitiniphilus eburneus]|uniref:biliverdin-producing heme oxygenase n=1 Tax=Chitiniphilus eburneus TaxID=2571148 RepID=UPI0035CF1D93